jgi:site-specific DNA recombinase
MTTRIYLRRSKSDAGKQEFSIDVQRAGCHRFAGVVAEGEAAIVEYLDDGKAGDDFYSRTDLRRLVADTQPGDSVIVRDQSRLGRDALEVTLVVRDLVRDRGCRLFYYATGSTVPVPFATAIDQATTFIQGTGSQMELESIRSRTREALRDRVRAGRIAGGACYGYRLERKADAISRKYTTATVDEAQAAVVARLYAGYHAGLGLKALARALNREGVPPPKAGRRGSGSWAPTCIRAMLQNPRYRGVYVHGKIKKLRRAGEVSRVRAEPTEIMIIDIPEWRIVDDETWFAVQERFASRVRDPSTISRHGGPAARYPLTGIAKCGACGGAIGCSFAVRRGARVKAYACSRHHTRGREACPVTVYQPMEEVEEALIDYLQREVFTADVMQAAFASIRQEIAAQLPRSAANMDELEAQLAAARAEQKKLARAVALADDIPELVAELQERSARLRHLEVQLAAARRTPNELAEVMTRVETSVRAKLVDLHAALAGQQEDRRAAFLDMFPGGLRFDPVEVGRRRVWRIQGEASLAPLRDLPQVAENTTQAEDLPEHDPREIQITLRPQRDLNPCRLRERQVS